MIRLVPDDETEVLSFGPASRPTTFTIQHLNAGHVEDCVREATIKGRYDPEVYDLRLWHRILRGWSGLIDAKDREVPFADDPALKRKVVRALPPTLKNEIHSRALGSVDAETAALGNSGASSANG